jgi:hypothetical protein
MGLMVWVLLQLGLVETASAQDSAAVPAATAPLFRAAETAELAPAVDVSTPAQPVPPPRTAAAGGPRAMDSLDLGTTSITGNQELPKVLYIVPWKRSDLGDLLGRPVGTLLDEVLAPVDPEVFERQLGYYDALHEANSEE